MNGNPLNGQPAGSNGFSLKQRDGAPRPQYAITPTSIHWQRARREYASYPHLTAAALQGARSISNDPGGNTRMHPVSF